MNNLVKNEIIKVLKKKNFRVMIIILVLFLIITNAGYKYIYKESENEEYNEKYIEMIENDIKTLNPNNSKEVDMYIDDKSEIDTYNLLKKYDKNSWQYAIVEERGKDYFTPINEYTYKTKDDELLEFAKSEYDKFEKRLNLGDWKEFVKEELEAGKKTKTATEGQQTNELDLQIEALQMRLDYNIEYGDNYKNNALNKYIQSKSTVNQLEKDRNKTHDAEIQYQTAKEDMEKSKYAIENGRDILSKSNARALLLKVFSEYEIFIVLAIVLVAGAIVSDEFNKGTIKLLLIRPYKRTKILLAKFITVLIFILAVAITTVILQFIVGGIFFGFGSLSIPAVEYDHNAGKIVEMSILKNVLLTGLGKLPIYIIIGSLAFTLSSLFASTSAAIIWTVPLYVLSGLINSFAAYFNVKILKYFITPNWNLAQFLYGKIPEVSGINIWFSAIVCLIYFILIITPAFIVFRKMDIKNI